jgi:hypothetical protein
VTGEAVKRILEAGDDQELARLARIGAAALSLAGRGGAAPPDRLSYRREETAGVVGVSPDFFDAHVRPEIRAIRRGRVTLYPVSELERWVKENASLAIEEGRDEGLADIRARSGRPGSWCASETLLRAAHITREDLLCPRRLYVLAAST